MNFESSNILVSLVRRQQSPRAAGRDIESFQLAWHPSLVPRLRSSVVIDDAHTGNWYSFHTMLFLLIWLGVCSFSSFLNHDHSIYTSFRFFDTRYLMHKNESVGDQIWWMINPSIMSNCFRMRQHAIMERRWKLSSIRSVLSQILSEYSARLYKLPKS